MELKVEIVNVMADSSKCVLCLELKDDLMAIVDGAEEDIVAILCRHFWFSSESISNQSICTCCWSNVEKFHQFYRQVERLYALDAELKTHHVVKNEIFSEPEVIHIVCSDESDDVEWKLQTDNMSTEYAVCDSQHTSVSLNVAKQEKHEENCAEEASPANDSKEDDFLIDVDEGDFMIANHTCLNCPICPFSTSTFLKLTKHIRDDHKMSGYVNCCGKKFFSRSRLLDHVVKLGDPNAFTCEICNKSFAGSYTLNEHKLKHTSSQASGRACIHCYRVFGKKSELNRHRKHCGSIAEEFICSTCHKKFSHIRSLKQHCANVHGPQNIICEQCPARFKTWAQCRIHQRSKHHTIAESRKQCNICKRWLKNASTLRKHIYRHQSSSESNVCDICGKDAPNALALRSHISFVHRKQRTFECTICGKGFKRAFALQEHLTIHTGNVLYNCAHCSRTFNSSANMHAHKKKAHQQEWEQSRMEDEQKFKCEIKLE